MLIVSLTSFLACVAVAFIWVRSYYLSDELQWRPRVHATGMFTINLIAYSGNGGLLFCADRPLFTYESSELSQPRGRHATPFSYQSGCDPQSPSEIESQKTIALQSAGEALGFGFRRTHYVIREHNSFEHPRLGTVWMTSHGASHDAVFVPHWFLALVFGAFAVPGVRVVIAARRRARSGRCPRCGYDLRATPDRCPECGEAGVAARPA